MSKPLKILVVGNGSTATDASGTSYINKHSCQFLIDLAEAGHSVSFLQPEEAFDRHSNLYDRAIPAGTIRRVSLKRTGLVSTLRSGVLALSALLRADFVYAFFPGTLPRRVAALCRLLAKPYGLYLRGERFGSGRADDSIFRGARFIVSVSQALAAPVAPLNRNIIVIRPMLDLSAADAVQRDLSRPRAGPLRLLFVGRLEQAKGIAELVEAAGILERRGLDFELSLVGGGPLHAELYRRFGDEPGARVRLPGAIADKERLMRYFEQADLFVLPTYHEGFPRVLYEAMIKSVAVITTMVGGIPGLMKDGENCIAIPVRDAGAIADAVERLAGDPQLLQRLADNGLATVLDTLANRPSHLEAVLSRLDG